MPASSEGEVHAEALASVHGQHPDVADQLLACSEAHFLGRALRQQGHDVCLIAAQFVKPFAKSIKNDFVDAEAIAEALERKNMRFVLIKTDDRLDLQSMHRIRDRLLGVSLELTELVIAPL